MKAIITKYHGPGNTRGSRVSADDGDGNRVMLSIDSEWQHQQYHSEAVKALCKKMGWHGRLYGGWTTIKGRQCMAWTWCDNRSDVVEVK